MSMTAAASPGAHPGLDPAILRAAAERRERPHVYDRFDPVRTAPVVEQNVRKALLTSDRAVVLELGQVRLQDTARALVDDARVAQLYMGLRPGGAAA